MDVDTISEVVERAFLYTHQGYSTDDVIICDRLNAEFVQVCRRELPLVEEEIFNWRLMSLRKQGKLGRVTRRRKHENHEDYLHAAEIAARYVYDKYSKTVDRAFCNPELKLTFDVIACEVAPDISSYRLRKAALKLRKNRQLRPELVPRVASWGKRVLSFAADDIVANPNLVPRLPGVYIFRDTSGYLYIGESGNLCLRIRQHLDHSDRKSLAHYLWEKGFKHITIELHVFDANSDARQKRCRQAYESNLIQVRQPRFNMSP